MVAVCYLLATQHTHTHIQEHMHKNTGNTGTTIIPKEAWIPLILSDANDLSTSAGWRKDRRVRLAPIPKGENVSFNNKQLIFFVEHCLNVK